MPVIDSIWNAVVGCRHRRTTFPFTPARAKPGGPAHESHHETYVVCLDCGKQFLYDWEKMRLGGPVDLSTGEPVPAPPTAHVPFRTKSKMRYLLWGSAISAAVVLGKAAHSRRQSRSKNAKKPDGQDDGSEDTKAPGSA
jgi:hypothetical protein